MGLVPSIFMTSSCGYTPPPLPPVEPEKPESSFSIFLKNFFKNSFGLDIRSMALFRVGLALLLLSDYFKRFCNLQVFYSDFGVLPRSVLIEKFSSPWMWSLHYLSGQSFVMALFFIFGIVAALFLLIGYRTQLALFVSWILLISLHTRNPIILQAGDVVLRMLLFWGLFLPLGAFASVDRALHTGEIGQNGQKISQKYFSWGVIALTLQVAFIYWFTAVLKTDSIWRTEGSAVYYALSLEQFSKPIAFILLQYPLVLKGLTFSTLVWEYVGPYFLFIPFFNGAFRLIAIAGFISLHAGLHLFMALGNFPFICMVAWLVFLPTCFWDFLQKKFFYKIKPLQIYFDGDCGFCKKMVLIIKDLFLVRTTEITPAQEVPAIYSDMLKKNSWIVIDPTTQEKYFHFSAFLALCRASPVLFWLLPFLRISLVQKIGNFAYKKIATHRQTASKISSPFQYRALKLQVSKGAEIFVIICLIYICAWNVRTLNFKKYEKYFPTSMNFFGHILRLDQMWNMFAPYPTKESGWYVIDATLANGQKVDLFNDGKPLTFDRPASIMETYRDQHWRKYLMNLWSKDYKDYRLYYGKYLCRNWNDDHQGDNQLKTFNITFMKRMNDYKKPPVGYEPVVIWSHDCFAKDK